jgi:hypothetical protein
MRPVLDLPLMPMLVLAAILVLIVGARFGGWGRGFRPPRDGPF